MSLVLDSSATLAWIHSDETTEALRRLFNMVAEDGAVVPALWRLEVANSQSVFGLTEHALLCLTGRIHAPLDRFAIPVKRDPL